MSRSWPVPHGNRTIHLIGDTHFGAIASTRATKAMGDLTAKAALPTVAAHLQLGDLTNDGTSGQDATALAWLAQLDAPWYAAVGNHDLWSGRSGDTAASAWGKTKNQVVDLGFAALIIVGPDAAQADNTSILLTSATLTWLNAQLQAVSPLPALIACHAPLYETVGMGEPTTGAAAQWVSTEAGFFVLGNTYANRDNGVRDSDVRQVMADNSNAKAWLSGHTHSPLSATNLVQSLTLGSHVVAQVNASSLYYQGRTQEASDPMESIYLTYLSDRIEVRFRNHGAGVWTTRASERVATVML